VGSGIEQHCRSAHPRAARGDAPYSRDRTGRRDRVRARRRPSRRRRDAVLRRLAAMKDQRSAGRVLSVVLNDRESEARTPSTRLYRIPDDAHDPFTPHPPGPALRPGENDLTRIAPGRPRAAGEGVVIEGRIVDADLRPVRRTLVEIWNANAHG